MPISKADQQLLARLLLATYAIVIRGNPSMRREVIALLVRDHEPELVSAVVEKHAA